MKVSRILPLVREYLFFGGCALCGNFLLDPEEAWYGICDECRALFAVSDENRCVSCGRPLISEKERCLPCREGKSYAFDGAFALYPYTGKYQELLKAYKFGRFPALANFFADKLREVLPRFTFLRAEEAAGTLRWVPVPPRPGKMHKTGWDQIACLTGRLRSPRLTTPGGRLRKTAAEERFPPVCRCLKRLPSKSQKELNREDRKTNLKGRIICVHPPPPVALLFDDVITTGSTLDACAAALKEGGAQKVYAFALFYD
jgi:predicted amidophosphoribosyltransferase